MTDIEILETYTPLCHDCGWSGEEVVYFSDARDAGDAHECTGGER